IMRQHSLHGLPGSRKAFRRKANMATAADLVERNFMPAGPDRLWVADIERPRRGRTERRCKAFSAWLSQQPGEAGGSLTRRTPGRVDSSPDNDGTCRHGQTVRVRQARRDGVREKSASERSSSEF